MRPLRKKRRSCVRTAMQHRCCMKQALRHMLEAEVRCVRDLAWNQREISLEDRQRVVECAGAAVHRHETGAYGPSLTFLAVEIMDQFLARRLVRREDLDLLAATCVALACKLDVGSDDGLFEGATRVLQWREWADVGPAMAAHLRHSECVVMQALDYRLLYPTAADFLWHFGAEFCYPDDVIALALRLLEHSLSALCGPRFLPSQRATAALHVAANMLDGGAPTMRGLCRWQPGYDRQATAPCCEWLVRVLATALRHPPHWLSDKYARAIPLPEITSDIDEGVPKK